MKNETGFSLVEFLVSTMLTLVVLGISLATFSDAVNINQLAGLVADTDQNLRSGLTMLTRDLIQAGEGIPTGGIPVPSGDGSTPVNRPGPVGVAYTFPAGMVLPAVTPGAGLGPLVVVQPTDLITVIYADPTLPLNGAPLVSINASGSRAEVDPAISITEPDSAVRAGDLIMFSNAVGNALQEVTGTDGAQTMFFDPGDPLNLNQPAAAQGTLVRLQSSPGAYPPTAATRVVMVSYYIDVSNPAGPRLVRQVGAGPRLAIALGIENLQLSFDLVDGATNPTNVKTAVAPNSPHEIRKVNVFLSARSEAPALRTQQVFRNSLATQVSLRSLSFVDRYR